jgi:hypothetical protein
MQVGMKVRVWVNDHWMDGTIEKVSHAVRGSHYLFGVRMVDGKLVTRSRDSIQVYP